MNNLNLKESEIFKIKKNYIDIYIYITSTYMLLKNTQEVIPDQEEKNKVFKRM